MEITTYSTYIKIKEGNNINNIFCSQIEVMRKEGTNIISIQTDKRSNYKIKHSNISLFNGSSTIPSIEVILSTLNAIVSTGSIEQSSGTFVNADLVANVLSVNHGLDFAYPTLKIEDPSGTVSTKDYTSVDSNNLEATFPGGVGAGTYKWTCIK